jgi:hypothetical protein
MEHAAKELAAKKPRQVYKEMVLTDEANAPKDIQQLRDLKHRNEKKTKTTTGNNIADERCFKSRNCWISLGAFASSVKTISL